MSNGATFEGVRRLQDTLDAAASDLESLAHANDQAGALLQAALIAEAPRLTGFLVTTIGTIVEAHGVTVVAGAPYSVAVNARDPFKARALDATTTQVIDIYTDAVADAVDQVQGA